jgi:hypothetical protein
VRDSPQVRRQRTVRRRPEAIKISVHDFPAVHSQSRRQAHAAVVERGTARVEDDPVRQEHGIFQQCERGIPSHECCVRGLDAGEIDFACHERGELGARLVDHNHDEPIEPGTSAQGRGELRVGGKHPAPVRFV